MKQKIKILFILNSFIFFFQLSFSQTKEELIENSSYAFEIYKQIHQNPELGKKEFITSELIKNELKLIGFTEFYEVPNLPTCVIATIDTNKLTYYCF
ncbi:MAG: hypothetical protein IPI22_13605 [Bacteroidetes bacterium]|nr:hypothetical protein [Bacteroidota bacterium]